MQAWKTYCRFLWVFYIRNVAQPRLPIVHRNWIRINRHCSYRIPCNPSDRAAVLGFGQSDRTLAPNERNFRPHICRNPCKWYSHRDRFPTLWNENWHSRNWITQLQVLNKLLISCLIHVVLQDSRQPCNKIAKRPFGWHCDRYKSCGLLKLDS